MAGPSDPDVVELPPEAWPAREVPWFRDLLSGAGAASLLPRHLRAALALACLDLAMEVGSRFARAREAAVEAERAARAREEQARRAVEERKERARRDARRREAESREMRRRADEAALRREAAERLRRARKRYWRVLAWAGVVCVTALVPVLLGTATRDTLLRPRDPLLDDPSLRKGSDYFLSDWLAGTALVMAAAGLVLVVVAGMDRRRGLVAGHGRVALALCVAVLAAVPASVGRGLWDDAEAHVVRVVARTPVPDDRMDCPGSPLDLPFRGDVGTLQVDDGVADDGSDPSVFTIGPVAWRAALRTLAAPDASGGPEVGVCLYAGWMYAGTVSLGRVVEASVGSMSVAPGYPNGLVVLETSAPDGASRVLHGAPFPVAWGGRSPGAAESGASAPSTVTEASILRGGEWSAALPASPARVEVLHSAAVVVGPTGPETVGDLVVVGVDGVPTHVRAAAGGESWDVVGRTLVMIPDGAPASLVALGPALTIAWEAACPDGGAVVKQGEGVFVCGTDSAYRADLAAREWVSAG